MDTTARVAEARDHIRRITAARPEIGIILGSGLGHLADMVEDQVRIPYREIPHMAATTVELHSGELVIGRLEGREVVLMSGRLHHYEGHDLDAVTFPVRVLGALGVTELFVTNASGAINESYAPGEVMLIADHINYPALNPLRGPNDASVGPRFPEMVDVYTPRLRELAREAAAEAGLPVQEGVYAWWCGPSLETPAEIRMMRAGGADAVGMSTVPEVIVARYLGMNVLGMACIGNMASGVSTEPITAEEVAENVARTGAQLVGTLRGVLRRLP
ncbi:purine-nucleoside phosphorylase [Brevibacterium album]|uniref:purine-nucleoside phosphorylase n=1 Tax=Brevibacterium album TaxID=417948 RepID=UPI0004163B06|nr:purine-nucleoside phosphorylase [Brevibacterium album]